MTSTRQGGEQASQQESAAAAAPAPAGRAVPGLAERVVELQRTAGNRAVGHLLRSSGRTLARREVRSDAEISGGQDWTTADRRGNTQRWQQACLRNLNNVDSSQYRRIVERRDFYKWFYRYTVDRGYETRWALAASIVADGAHQIADMDEEHETANDILGLANVQLQGMMREGNQVIFDNVLPKLKRLLDGGALTGRAALDWDMQVLAEEQTLVQPMYSRMTQQTRDQLEYIARQRRFTWLGAQITGDARVAAALGYNRGGDVPAFDQPNLQSIQDRWRYGMGLGNRFAPNGTGWDRNRDQMPAAGADYTSGNEFRRLSTRQALHQLDAWLNPNRLARVGSGSDLNAILGALTEPEKVELLADSSPDGWAYSIQFAQFGFITEAQVRSALPSGAQHATAVSRFMDRYRAERRRVELRYPTPVPFGF